MLETDDIGIRAGNRSLVRDLTLTLPAGALLAVLGPNGVGKTLTLHTLAGLRAPAAGTVRIAGRPTGSYSRPVLARHVGLLMQSSDDPFPTTVRETALLGAHARTPAWRSESRLEERRVDDALARMNLGEVAGRPAASLSGGERRRLGIATLLVQDPAVMLFDEPLNHLDPPHEVAVLRLLGTLADSGRVVVASLHEPMLARQCFDFALLLHGDGRWSFGPVEQLVTTRRLAELYGVPFAEFRAPALAGEAALLAPNWPARARASAQTAELVRSA